MPTPRVFISYTRAEGEAVARALRVRLEEARVPLWQDRTGMEGGRDWWLQITAALDRVEFMVLVMTADAMASETVRKECRYARQRGVCIYPVKAAADLDFGALPGWLRSLHFYDLEHEWAKFVNDLNTRCQAARVPHMVEELPADFVRRPAEIERIVDLLLDERREPVAVTAALRGAGGYGKTTLAKAVCHDVRIQEAFDDGILWITLGQDPGDLAPRVVDLIETLSGERPGFASTPAAAAHLSLLLADRDILMVVDDVWNEEHLRPFLHGGARCARLITTRTRSAVPVRAMAVAVDAMTQDEAIGLLGAGLPVAEPSMLAALADRLGRWPVLLRLVNRVMRRRVEGARQDIREALASVMRALDRRGLVAFDPHDAVARDQAVSKTLRVSLDQLGKDEEARFRELAVFPEDTDIPIATVHALWAATGGLDEVAAEELCVRLSDLSLLLDLDLSTSRVRVHDVILRYLRQEQGATLPALHRTLLGAYAGSTWAALPASDAYLWRHLAWHLMQANRSDELRGLLLSVDWLQAKLAATDIGFLLADLDLAPPADDLGICPRRAPPGRARARRRPVATAGTAVRTSHDGAIDRVEGHRSPDRSQGGWAVAPAANPEPDSGGGPLVWTLRCHPSYLPR